MFVYTIRAIQQKYITSHIYNFKYSPSHIKKVKIYESNVNNVFYLK